jgi:hypothetical protein
MSSIISVARHAVGHMDHWKSGMQVSIIGGLAMLPP